MFSVDTLLDSDGLYQIIFPKGDFLLGDLPLCFPFEYTIHFRLLTIKEFRTFEKLLINNVLDEWKVFQLVFQRVYVGDYKVLSESMPVGVEFTIGQLVLHKSGLGLSSTPALKEALATARASYQGKSVVEHLKSVIATAFPSYTWEDFDHWTYDELFMKWSIAESILSKRIDGYQPMKIEKIGETEKTGGKQPINFAQENAGLRGQQNPLDVQAAMIKNQGLNKDQVKKLKK